MTYKEALEQLKYEIEEEGHCSYIEDEMKVAFEALEKQIPKKPVIKYHKEDVTPVKYGRLMEFHCPNCNKFIVAMYETDHKRGGGIHRDLKGCNTCLQAVDFGEYYHMSKLDDEIELE